MINKINSSNSPTFQSIKTAKIVGELTIKEIQREYPNYKSPSKWALRLLNVPDTPKFKILHPKIMKVLNRQYELLELAREKMNFSTVETYIHSIQELMRTKQVANCREPAALGFYRLFSYGIDAELFNADIVAKSGNCNDLLDRLCYNHFFIVMGRNKNKSFVKQSDWGNKAVIVDPWLGEAGSANELVRKYKLMFKMDETKETFEYNRVLGR